MFCVILLYKSTFTYLKLSGMLSDFPKFLLHFLYSLLLF